MSKALEPQDCLRGHQIIPTERLIAMVERAGFRHREGNNGSHRRYIHPDFPEIYFNIISNTKKRDTQFRAAHAVMRVRELQAQKSANKAPQPRDLWLRDLASKLNTEEESLELNGGIVTIRANGWPMIGVTLPVLASPELIEDKLYWFRYAALEFEEAVETCERLFGIQRSEDDGVLNLYHPAWRTACAFAPYGDDQAHNNPNDILGIWMGDLATRKQHDEKSTAAQTLATELRDTFKGDEVLCLADNRVIIRDQTSPQIGITLNASQSLADIRKEWRSMKIQAALFSQRLEEMTRELDFETRAGRRTLYFTHVCYENLSGHIGLYSKNGDNKIAFEKLDRLQDLVKARDIHLQLSLEHQAEMDKQLRLMSKTESNGFIRYKYYVTQNYTGYGRGLDVNLTINRRSSLAEDVKMHMALVAIHTHDLRKAFENMGYETALDNAGALNIQHHANPDLAYTIPDFRRIASGKNVFECAQARKPDDFSDDWFRQYADEKHILTLLVQLHGQACIDFTERNNKMIAKYNPIAEDIARCGYTASNRFLGRFDAEVVFKKFNPETTGPQEFAIPGTRIINSHGMPGIVIGSRGLEAIQTMRYQVAPPKPVIDWQSIFHGRPQYAFANALSAAPPQQDVKGAVPAIALPGLGGLKYNSA